MNLPHGNSPEARAERIEIRASAIARGIEWGAAPDTSDINQDEAIEIAAAEALAAEWLGRIFSHDEEAAK